MIIAQKENVLLAPIIPLALHNLLKTSIESPPKSRETGIPNCENCPKSICSGESVKIVKESNLCLERKKHTSFNIDST